MMSSFISFTYAISYNNCTLWYGHQNKGFESFTYENCIIETGKQGLILLYANIPLMSDGNKYGNKGK